MFSKAGLIGVVCKREQSRIRSLVEKGLLNRGMEKRVEVLVEGRTQHRQGGESEADSQAEEPKGTACALEPCGGAPKRLKRNRVMRNRLTLKEEEDRASLLEKDGKEGRLQKKNFAFSGAGPYPEQCDARTEP